MSDTIIVYRKHNAVISAALSDSSLTAIKIDDAENIYRSGNVFVGHVTKIIGHLNAAYVDIGAEKPCYMELKADAKYLTSSIHPDGDIHAGDDLVVQIVKEPIKTKPASVSPVISITKTHLVLSYSPKEKKIRFSSKIKDGDLKKKLTAAYNETVPEDYSVLFRTAVTEEDYAAIRKDYDSALNMLDSVVAYASSRKKGSLIMEADPGYLSFIRENRSADIKKIVTDSADLYVRITDFAKDEAPELTDKIIFMNEPDLRLENLYGMNGHFKELTNHRIWLKSGAQIIIEPTEALVSVDINTAKASAELKNFKDGFMKINLEAAEELRKQLILRNLSGIIMVDFINDKYHTRPELFDKVKEIFANDNNVKVEDITKLGLIEITRMRKNSTTEEQIKKFSLL